MLAKQRLVCMHVFICVEKRIETQHASNNLCSYGVPQPGFLRRLILMLSPRAASSFERCKPRQVRVRVREARREAWGASPHAATPRQVTDGEAALYGDPQTPSRRLQKPRLTAAHGREGARRGTSVVHVIPESSGSLIRIHPAHWVMPSGPRSDRSQSQMLRPVRGASSKGRRGKRIRKPSCLVGGHRQEGWDVWGR